MGRKKTRSDPGSEVSLFPFLSVLACVIGVLTLAIAALSISHLRSGRDPEEVARADEYVRMERQMREERELLERLRREVEEAKGIEEELQRLRPQATQSAPDISKEEVERLRRLLEDLKKQMADRSEAAERLKEEIARLEALLKELEADLETRQAALKGPAIMVKPGEAGRGKKYFFAEATREGLVLHGPGAKWRVPLKEIEKSKAFDSLCDSVKKAGQAVLVLLIRGDGIEAFQKAERAAQKAGVTVGRLPLVGQGPVDLSEFSGD